MRASNTTWRGRLGGPTAPAGLSSPRARPVRRSSTCSGPGVARSLWQSWSGSPGAIQFLPPSISPRVSPSSPVNAVPGVGLYAMLGGGHEGDGGLVRLGGGPYPGTRFSLGCTCIGETCPGR